MIDESLINAYRLAKYIVTYEEYRLHVGSTSEFVDRMLHHKNIKTAFFCRRIIRFENYIKK
jgi:predicted GIY-YIG superfamily endonuclease